MLPYIARRLIWGVPVVLLVSVVVFSFLHLSGGDPALMMLGENADPVVVELVRKDLGLDKPIPEQYWNWISKAARGDLGRSILPSRFRVGDLILQRAPVTIQLALSGIFLGILIGIPLGIITGINK